MTPLNKETEGVRKKRTAADDGVASSRKNTTGPFHLSSGVGVRSGNNPPPHPPRLPLPLSHCEPVSALLAIYNRDQEEASRE